MKGYVVGFFFLRKDLLPLNVMYKKIISVTILLGVSSLCSILICLNFMVALCLTAITKPLLLSLLRVASQHWDFSSCSLHLVEGRRYRFSLESWYLFSLERYYQCWDCSPNWLWNHGEFTMGPLHTGRVSPPCSKPNFFCNPSTYSETEAHFHLKMGQRNSYLTGMGNGNPFPC